MRSELAEADTLFELPGIISAIGRTIRTDFPRDQAGDLASLLPLITGPDIDRVVLGYPEFVDLPANPDVNYLLLPKRDAIREEMARIFGADELGPGRPDRGGQRAALSRHAARASRTARMPSAADTAVRISIVSRCDSPRASSW